MAKMGAHGDVEEIQPLGTGRREQLVVPERARRVERRHSAACTIQSHVRRVREMRTFSEMRAASRETKMRRASVVVQAAQRRHVAQKELRQHKAATAIQAAWRGFGARRGGEYAEFRAARAIQVSTSLSLSICECACVRACVC